MSSVTLLEIVSETISHLESCRQDESMTKGDVCDAIRDRMCILMGKIVSYPVMSNFALPVVAVDTTRSHNVTLSAFFNV